MKIKPGDTFGKLTVLYRCKENKWGKPLWHCKCSCPAGTELDIPDVSLKRGNKVNCGCEPKIYRDLRGKKYGKLTVVDIDHRTEDGRTYWKCICDCGKYSLEKNEYFIADQHSLVSKKCISCGCERGNDLKYDLIGQTFGTLEVIGHERGKGWECKCKNCGKITYHSSTHLTEGLVKGDGCLPKYEDFAGKTIGKLYVKKIDHRNENGVIYWLCDCGCGNKNVVKPAYYLRDTKSVVMRSCGCEDATTNKKYIEGNLVGKQYNNWLVIERAGKSPITGKSLWKCRCTKCNKTERIVVGNNLVSGTSKSCGCSITDPDGSLEEQEIRDYIKSISNESMEKTRILDGKEIDIYCRNLNIGIEYNGSVYHASLNNVFNEKDKDYHRNKFLCAKEKGIHLITIFDVDWQNNRAKIKAYLKDIFVHPTILYARNCDIYEIDKKEANDFCDMYHLQGASNQSKYHFGLYYEDELCAVMTFGRQRMKKNSDTDFELIRYCVKSGYSIVGGANRLLKAFESSYSPKYLISYSDNDYFLGDIYNKLGFVNVGQTALNYYWYLYGEELRRESCQVKKLKHKYPKLYVRAKFEQVSNKENFIMLALGARKVYRCGNTKWEKHYENNIS